MTVYRLLLAGLLVSSCAISVDARQKATDVSQDTTAGQSTETQKDTDQQLCRDQCGAIKQLHRLGGIYLAGQPSVDDLKKARDRGIKTIVSLREPKELNWDEEAAATQLGLQYQSIPFRSPESLTDAVFDKARKVLSDKEKRPLMLHCGTANRVGAVWLVHRALDDGVPVAQALDEAKTAGLRTPAYVDKAIDYVNRHQSE